MNFDILDRETKFKAWQKVTFISFGFLFFVLGVIAFSGNLDYRALCKDFIPLGNDIKDYKDLKFNTNDLMQFVYCSFPYDEKPMMDYSGKIRDLEINDYEQFFITLNLFPYKLLFTLALFYMSWFCFSMLLSKSANGIIRDVIISGLVVFILAYCGLIYLRFAWGVI